MKVRSQAHTEEKILPRDRQDVHMFASHKQLFLVTQAAVFRSGFLNHF
jgi:hypothetical protein